VQHIDAILLFNGLYGTDSGACPALVTHMDFEHTGCRELSFYPERTLLRVVLGKV
jgi:hypothetical protein